MPTRESLENLVYQQKRAHKNWLSEAIKQGVKPTAEEDELVWELLLSYGESADNISAVSEDIYKTAHELATITLTHLPIERIRDIYRDNLLDAMLDATDRGIREHVRSLIRFTNLISTAFCEAHADMLKKTIRHNRAESISNELKVAKSIQRHLLPKVIPTIPGFEFAGRLVPAAEVGGDYWSVKYYENDDIVTLKLADISGHGIAAATLVAAVKFISGGYYHRSESAAEVIRQTNRVLTKETPYDILVTMAYGWLHPHTYELTMVNAGHEPVFICRKNLCIDIYPTGPVLGVAEAEYSEKTYKLSKDDIVFFGSDGIIEAGIAEPFGMERLKKLVLDLRNKSAAEIADGVVQAVTNYEQYPHDDISMLLVKVTGEPPGSR